MIKDVRYVLRSLVQAPGFSLTACIILAIGLGLAMYMFGAINRGVKIFSRAANG